MRLKRQFNMHLISCSAPSSHREGYYKKTRTLRFVFFCFFYLMRYSAAAMRVKMTHASERRMLSSGR